MLRTSVHAGPILLGGMSSDYESVSGRSYDYGPGVSARVAATFGRDNQSYLKVSHEQFWIHAISGNNADHFHSLTRLRFNAPLRLNVGLGAEYLLILSERTYQDYPDVSARLPQTRIFFTWDM